MRQNDDKVWSEKRGWGEIARNDFVLENAKDAFDEVSYYSFKKTLCYNTPR